MKVFRGLGKAIPKIIKRIRKRYGVNCRIYRVTNWDDKAVGNVNTSKLIFEEEPYYTGKMLIPSLVDEHNDESLDIFESVEEDSVMYCLPTEEFPEKSLVVLDTSNTTGMSQFIINKRITVKDDERHFYYEYELATEFNVHIEETAEDILDSIEISDIKIDEGLIIPDKSTGDQEVVKSTEQEFELDEIS